MANYGKPITYSWILDLGDSNGRIRILGFFLILIDKDECSYTESSRFGIPKLLVSVYRF